MAYQTITATNMELQCGIMIKCVATGEPVGEVSSVVLKKRYAGASVWKNIATVEINTVSDFTFTHFDADTRSGATYNYVVVPVIDEVEQPGVLATCKCEFGGIYIGDSTGSWISLYNNEYSMQKNTQVSYITTLAGKFPRRVSNASTDYLSGSVTGLFLPFTETGFPMKEKAREYKDAVLQMLTNGKAKLLKTYDGNAWIVSVDATPKENFSLFDGASTISFNWTQIGEVEAPPKTIQENVGADFDINYDGSVSFRTVAMT